MEKLADDVSTTREHQGVNKPRAHTLKRKRQLKVLEFSLFGVFLILMICLGFIALG